MPSSIANQSVLSQEQVILVSVLHAKPGFEKLILEELLKLIHFSRQEAGCLIFDLYRVAGNEARIFLHEVWESRDAFEAHSSNFHTTRFRASVSRHLERPAEVLEIEEIM